MNKKFLCFTVNRNLDETELLAVLEDHRDDLERFLIDRMPDYPRANLVEGSLVLELVESHGHHPNTFYLQYSFDWEAHLGCSDWDHADTDTRTDMFTYRDGEIKFEKEVVEERTTHEEY